MKIPAKVRHFLNAGEKKLRNEKYPDALDDFLKALELDRDNPEIHYYLGITYTRLEDYERGTRHLEEVLASELAYIHRVHAQMILGYLYTIKEDFEKALAFFKGIVKSGFNNAQAHAAVGYIMDRMGNFKEAVMNLYRSLEIDPKNANAHNSLGFIFAEAGINLEEALQECKKALSLDENNPAYLDSIGWVYYKMGKLTQARIYLKKAYDKVPNNPEIKDHLRIVEKSRKKKP
jgi:Flp pilus assembly protein TadD